MTSLDIMYGLIKGVLNTIFLYLEFPMNILVGSFTVDYVF